MALDLVMRFGRSLHSEFDNLFTSSHASSCFKGRKLRIINLISIAYASRPRLRSRLTQGRTSLPWNPRVYGGHVFNMSLRYSCLHTHFHTLQVQSPFPFYVYGTLSYHSAFRRSPELRYNAYRQLFSAQDHSMSKLLRIF